MKLPDADYVLTDGAAWIEVKGFSIRIMSTDEGVIVDVYAKNKENNGPITTTYAFDSECCEE